MRHWHVFDRSVAMASRWRRRRVCHLIQDGMARSVALRAIDGRGAWIDIDEAPALGSSVELRHPDAGSIRGTVSEIGMDAMRIRFDPAEGAVAFALAATASDMTRG
jgi:hypothetical protein